MQLGVLPSDNVGPLIAAIACGVCLGFLPFNFYPARVFMGDAGALLLGLMLSASTMVIGGRFPVGSLPLHSVPVLSGVTYFFFAPLFIPLFILGVPILDMAFAFVRRTARGTGFHTPDKEHIHHRLLRLGHGHRRSVLILWAWTAVLSGFVLFPLFIPRVNAIIPFGAAALGVGLYTLFHPGLRRRDADGQPIPVPVNGRPGPNPTGPGPGVRVQPGPGRRAVPDRAGEDHLVLTRPAPRPGGSHSADSQGTARQRTRPAPGGFADGRDEMR
jgi:UDP-GlcNAc:undecaprenyl-phosphate GlcNAc-1-phosphate transferase